MPHRVFHKGLQGQGGDGKIRGRQLVHHIDPRAEAQLLQLQIIFAVGQLLGKGDRLPRRQGIHIAPQEHRKAVHRLFRPARVRGAQALDGGQRIVEEVGLDLAEHHRDAHFRQLQFPLLHAPGLLHLEEEENNQNGYRGGQVQQGHAVYKNLHAHGQHRQRDIGPQRRRFLGLHRAAVADQHAPIDAHAEDSPHLGKPKPRLPVVDILGVDGVKQMVELGKHHQ